MINKKLKVAAYGRVSTDKEDQANSLISQKTYFEDYIKKNEEWEFVGIYYDDGVSGTQAKNRDGFQSMINDALNGKIDLILIKDVSRFSRNTLDSLNFIRQLTQNNVNILFTTQGIDTRTPGVELLLSILSALAQEESHSTSEKVKWGQRRQMEKGVVFGRAPLGYNLEKGVLTINEDEAPIIKSIFHKYTNEGKGTWIIAKELEEEGITPARGIKWTNTVILKILRNEKYMGDLCQQKTYTPDFITHKKKYNKDKSTMIHLSNHHEPIIDKDLWDRTQDELIKRSPSDEQKSKHSNRYWCSGKLICSSCGCKFVHKKREKKTTTHECWQCHEKYSHGSLKQDKNGAYIGCNTSSINMQTLTFCMNYCINMVRGDVSKLKQQMLKEISKAQEQTKEKYDITKVNKKINTIKQKKIKLIDLLADSIISTEDFTNQNKKYDEDLFNLNNLLTDIELKQKEEKLIQNNLDKFSQTIDEILNCNETNEKLYNELLNKIIVSNNSIDIWLNNLPIGIRFTYSTSGRGQNYTTTITGHTYLYN